jgi:3-methyladenine DNA glycosylase/8-oxoguanine DNA glycosylase
VRIGVDRGLDLVLQHALAPCSTAATGRKRPRTPVAALRTGSVPAVPRSRAVQRSFAAESAALAELDPRFAPLLDAHGPAVLRGPTPAGRRFESLAESIAYQQLNGTAAATIWGRVRALVDGPFTPDAVLALPEDQLRGAGLSGSKTRAMLDLAAHADDGRLPLRTLGRLGDDDVVAQLTQVWGIGRWTAHMVLIFDLHRLDVWPVDDYGVQVGWSRICGLGETPKAKEMLAMGEALAPYRSLAAWYCWRVVDG